MQRAAAGQRTDSGRTRQAGLVERAAGWHGHASEAAQQGLLTSSFRRFRRRFRRLKGGGRKPLARPYLRFSRATFVALGLMVAPFAVGCSPAPIRPVVSDIPSAAVATTTSALAVVTTAAGVATTASQSSPPPAKPKLHMIEDDIPGAMAKAKAENKALFVEVWAPWCHTCLSMKNFVLPDPAIAVLTKRVVFATVDSDRDANAAFMDRYAVNAWPTLFVLDPANGAVLGLQQGAVSVGELRTFINDAADLRDAKLSPKGPMVVLLAARRARAKAKWRLAAGKYRLALERGGEGWGRRSEALEGLIFSDIVVAKNIGLGAPRSASSTLPP